MSVYSDSDSFTESCADEDVGISFYKDANSDDMEKFENAELTKGIQVMAIHGVPTWGWKPQALECIIIPNDLESAKRL